MKRIFLEIGLFLVIIIAPWWVSVIFALALLYYFKSFNEISPYIRFGLNPFPTKNLYNSHSSIDDFFGI